MISRHYRSLKLRQSVSCELLYQLEAEEAVEP